MSIFDFCLPSCKEKSKPTFGSFYTETQTIVVPPLQPIPFQAMISPQRGMCIQSSDLLLIAF